MGSLANTVFTFLTGWSRTAISALWSLFTGEYKGGLFRWVGEHWLLLAGILCLIGMTVDILVYMNNKRKKNGIQEPVFAVKTPDEKDYTPSEELSYMDEVSFSRWEDKGQPAEEQAVRENTPSIVTAAGYVVPEDSPYRRPAEPGAPRMEMMKENTPSIKTTMKTSRRRTRINVGDLFSSPEEEIIEFEAPQHLIDRNQAYRKPVYPRNWKQDGNQEENG